MFHMKQLDDLIHSAEVDLKTYLNLLNKWQKAVNLVADSTLSDAWNRHIIDSAQIYTYIPKIAKILVDMGSGAGLPALVLAILNQKNNGPLNQIILIESDTKKTLFLKEVVRTLHLPVQIINQRIEKVTDVKADVLTARALTDLTGLLTLGRSFIQPETVCLFLKGKTVDSEIKQCPYHYALEKIKSITNSNSYLVEITEVKYD